MKKTTDVSTDEKPYSRPLFTLVNQGKVRDLYVPVFMPFLTSNRLSVFDRVIKEDVPMKGAMLNCISQANKMYLSDEGFCTDYIPTPDGMNIAALLGLPEEANKRISLAIPLEMLPFEFIVRGYLVGSAWKAYSKGEAYCGFTFPEGLKQGDKLPEPIVTPTTKESTGHDKPVTKEECIEMMTAWLIDNGYSPDAVDLIEEFEENYSSALVSSCYSKEALTDAKSNYSDDAWEQLEYAIAYKLACEVVETVYSDSLAAFKILSGVLDSCGVIFIDTKFEFGIDPDGEICLGDEVGTPDSSRFADAEVYNSTGKIVSMDKQIIRDYCQSIGFTGEEDQPIPEIPDEVWEKVTATYVNLAVLICSEDFVDHYR